MTNLEEVADGGLKKFHLKGMAVACEGLILYPDNRKVHKSFLVTCGKLEMAEFQLEARHLWREVLRTIKLPPVDTCYSEGEMCSDYICSEEVIRSFHTQVEDGVLKPVLAAKLLELGTGSFCLRISCQLSRSFIASTGVWLTYTILIVPEEEGDPPGDPQQQRAPPCSV